MNYSLNYNNNNIFIILVLQRTLSRKIELSVQEEYYVGSRQTPGSHHQQLHIHSGRH